MSYDGWDEMKASEMATIWGCNWQSRCWLAKSMKNTWTKQVDAKWTATAEAWQTDKQESADSSKYTMESKRRIQFLPAAAGAGTVHGACPACEVAHNPQRLQAGDIGTPVTGLKAMKSCEWWAMNSMELKNYMESNCERRIRGSIFRRNDKTQNWKIERNSEAV